MTIKPRDLSKALTAKGFRKVEGGDHDFYFYYDENGNKTKIRTKLSRGSHGKKPIDESMIGIIKEQMHFDKKEQLIQFVECKFTAEDYRNMINKKNLK